MQLTEPTKWRGDTMRRTITLSSRFAPGEVDPPGPDFEELVEPVVQIVKVVAPVIEVEEEAEPPEIGGLHVCLDCWKRWMLSDDRDLSASRMKFDAREAVVDEFDEDGNIIRQAYETNPYDEQLKADNVIGMATGAMIDSLNKWQRWAIHKKCAVVTVWEFPQMDYMATLIEAEKELEIKLRKNLATATQF